ncbi:MAG: hypothetical protein CMN32_08700 [Saprospirales bacterium]|nr:hypothetical protein [Saprospirales bacterium]
MLRGVERGLEGWIPGLLMNLRTKAIPSKHLQALNLAKPAKPTPVVKRPSALNPAKPAKPTQWLNSHRP